MLKHQGTSIEERPKEVAARSTFGHWEGDTVCSKDHKPGINTLVERKSGYLCVQKLKSRKSEATTEAVVKSLALFPETLRQTLTLDNGTKNMGWEALEQVLKLKTYFAHPYSSGERGTNENTNGLLREYFPKKTDFTTISVRELEAAAYKLNTRPRKRLGYLTPLEVMSVALES